MPQLYHTIDNLNLLLEQERERFLQENERASFLAFELDRAKRRFEKQIQQKENRIHNENQMREVLRRQKNKLLNDKEELKAALLAEENKSKRLQEELDDLRLQMASLQGTSTSEMDLKEELDQIKVLCQELSSNFDSEILEARQEVETLKQQLHKEVSVYTQERTNTLQLLAELKAEHDSLCQMVSKDLADFIKELSLETELEGLKTQLEEKNALIRQLLRDNPAPSLIRQQVHLPLVCVQRVENTQESRNPREPGHHLDSEILEISEENPREIPKPKKKSSWRRARRCLCVGGKKTSTN